MAENLRWRERAREARRTQRAAPPATPLRALAAGIAQAARQALAEPYMLKVERREISLSRLPRRLDRLRIVHLSDIHHSPFTGTEQIERAIETANSLEPDLIALTGDYVSHESTYAAPCAELMG